MISPAFVSLSKIKDDFDFQYLSFFFLIEVKLAKMFHLF
jgi:hypothetical protein